jgi:hypothetical protein
MFGVTITPPLLVILSFPNKGKNFLFYTLFWHIPTPLMFSCIQYLDLVSPIFQWRHVAPLTVQKNQACTNSSISRRNFSITSFFGRGHIIRKCR